MNVDSQRLARVDLTACDRDERLFCYTSHFGLVHEVPTGVVETCKQTPDGNIVMGPSLPSPQVP